MILLGSFYDDILFSVSESSLIRQFSEFIDQAVSYFHHEPIEHNIGTLLLMPQVTTTFRNVFLRGNINEENKRENLPYAVVTKKIKNEKHVTFRKSSTVPDKTDKKIVEFSRFDIFYLFPC